MSKLQKILMGILVVVLVVLIIIFWGSIFSVIMTVGLLGIIPIYLFNRFINTDETSDFVDVNNG